MKTLLKIAEMMPYLPTQVKDAIHHMAHDVGAKTDDLELHRHSHSEKAKVNELDPTSRKSLAYVSHRSQDRDDEIVIPKSLRLDEFRKYMSVLVNHNYSLLPVGSDEWIDADDFGIKALTVHADTGAGTMANVVWDLTRQGHLKGRSVGFVPLAFTKPGARDWDHVANGLQSNWKEFDKARAEKSISRIITDGVLLEHSFVSVPCNTSAEFIGVIKGMNLDSKVAKQLGWEMKDGILVTKAVAEPVPCVCDECGFVQDAVPGGKCPECKTGTMKAKGKEKSIVIISTKQEELNGPRTEEQRAMAHFEISEEDWDALSDDEKQEYIDKLPPRGTATGGVKSLDLQDGDTFERNGEKYRVTKILADEKANVPCTCDECGTKAECAPGSTCQELDCDGTMVEDKKQKAVGDGRGRMGGPYSAGPGGVCKCPKCGATKEHDAGVPCTQIKCPKCGAMMVRKEVEGEGKPAPEIKVVRPAPSVKVLFVPPSGAEIAQRVGDAVEKALSRRTGKIL